MDDIAEGPERQRGWVPGRDNEPPFSRGKCGEALVTSISNLSKSETNLQQMQDPAGGLMQMEGGPVRLRNAFTLICNPSIYLLIGLKPWQREQHGLQRIFLLSHALTNTLFLPSATPPAEKIKFRGKSAHAASLCRRQACIRHASLHISWGVAQSASLLDICHPCPYSRVACQWHRCGSINSRCHAIHARLTMLVGAL